MRARLLGAVLLAALCTGCRNDADPSPPGRDTLTVPTGTLSASGRLVYVPVYSHIYYRNAQRQMNLTATLSIRNVDMERPVEIHRVDYYDSEGLLVRKYVDEPVTIGPLSSRAYVVEEDDTHGGVGANFIVEWDGETSRPVIQAVMITTASTQGISFVTDGIPIEPAP